MIDSYEEDGLELESFDVADIENPYILLLTLHLPVRTRHATNVEIHQLLVDRSREGLDFVFAIYKNCYRRELLAELFNFGDPIGQPFCQSITLDARR